MKDRGNGVNKENTGDNEEDDTICCINCKSEIIGKPWTIVHFPEDNYTVYACKYLCSKDLKYHIGKNYWKNVVNKEDFPGPRPVQKLKEKKDITANFGIESIKQEILMEEERIKAIEEDYKYDEDEFYFSDD